MFILFLDFKIGFLFVFLFLLKVILLVRILFVFMLFIVWVFLEIYLGCFSLIVILLRLLIKLLLLNWFVFFFSERVFIIEVLFNKSVLFKEGNFLFFVLWNFILGIYL